MVEIEEKMDPPKGNRFIALVLENLLVIAFFGLVALLFGPYLGGKMESDRKNCIEKGLCESRPTGVKG